MYIFIMYFYRSAVNKSVHWKGL